MLRVDDLSPPDFAIPCDSWVERILKRPVRRFAYPFYNLVGHSWLARTYLKNAPLQADRWLWGQRGNDYDSHRRRVNRLLPVEKKRILVAGCGTGRDIYTWLRFRPELLIGADILNYRKVWNLIERYAEKRFPATEIRFVQSDASDLHQVPDGYFDVIASDALLEHVRELPSVAREFFRILKRDGILYSTFGPLWYCWGGDHISGYDGLSGGYNHLLLEDADYRGYLEAAGPFTHSEHDGRTWINEGLFGYLRPGEYLEILESSGFEKVYTAAVIDPRSIRFSSSHPAQWDRLKGMVPHETDLMISGMTIVDRKG